MSGAVAIVDYGMGNVASVANMIRKVGGESALTRDPDDIARARKVILPGVGAFDAGMQALRASGVDRGLAAALSNGAAVLGICLGFQLLFEGSEEGVLPGLGLVKGKVVRFRVESQDLRVPHMGWNTVVPARDSILFPGRPEEELRYYFVHSYHAECADAGDVAAVTTHGREFACAIERGRLLGVQFHPEKSHRFGMALLKRFLDA